MAALLQVCDLTASYGKGSVLHGIGFSVEAGGITAMLGANGAGKTTTLRAISGLIRAAGSIRFDGRELVGARPELRARLGIAHVPEGRGTFAGLTAEENLRLGAYARRDAAGMRTDIDRIYDLCPRLKARRRQQAGSLSGGEQQMLAIARALMSRPRLLVLDEPSFGVAPRIVQQIFQLIETINRDEGVSILLVEQNAALALGIAREALLIESGRIRAADSAARLRADPTIRQSYLGQLKSRRR
jgi:branched-chain amino acid transport system ATP-binding protein